MADGNGLEISAGAIWNKTERFEFSASAWPTHTDKAGKECRVIPHDLGSEWQGSEFKEREPTPTTTAARSRTPEAIARQIENKLIPEYKRVYKILEEVAESRQAYANKEADIITRLFKATQEERLEGSKPYFVRNIGGDTLTIDYRSPGSILIDLSADDMVAVIEFLRQKRKAATAKAERIALESAQRGALPT